MSTTPTGRREVRDGTPCLVIEREYAATVEDVWAAVTEPERLERWIGTWSGDPASGEITFTMTSEGDDAPAEVHVVEVCEPPRRFVVHSKATQPSHPDGTGAMVWRMAVEITDVADGARLTFTQDLTQRGVAESIGPGWEYYADRLGAAIAGGDVATVDWDVYYPSRSAHYRELFG